MEEFRAGINMEAFNSNQRYTDLTPRHNAPDYDILKLDLIRFKQNSTKYRAVKWLLSDGDSRDKFVDDYIKSRKLKPTTELRTKLLWNLHVVMSAKWKPPGYWGEHSVEVSNMMS
jgi:hypothetical protein